MLNLMVRESIVIYELAQYIRGLIGVFAWGTVSYTRQNKKKTFEISEQSFTLRLFCNYVIKSGTFQKMFCI